MSLKTLQCRTGEDLICVRNFLNLMLYYEAYIDSVWKNVDLGAYFVDSLTCFD